MKYFFNLYFLLLACSQFVPDLKLGALYTYWAPLVSLLFISFITKYKGAISYTRDNISLSICLPETWVAPNCFALTKIQPWQYYQSM